MTRNKTWLLAAGVSAAALVGGAISALAADLPYRDYGRNGTAYEDPRYADLYGDAPPAPERRYVPPHQPQYGYNNPPIPREPVYRDAYRPRQYVEVEPRHRAYSAGPGCMPRDEIKFGLERDGWRDFRDPQIIDRGTALLTARRQGRLFELKVDRCSGDIIAARPLEPSQRSPYADYEGRPPYRIY
jgi:signal peptidase I